MTYNSPNYTIFLNILLVMISYQNLFTMLKKQLENKLGKVVISRIYEGLVTGPSHHHQLKMLDSCKPQGVSFFQAQASTVQRSKCILYSRPWQDVLSHKSSRPIIIVGWKDDFGVPYRAKMDHHDQIYHSNCMQVTFSLTLAK
jgi:hypothetical protein